MAYMTRGELYYKDYSWKAKEEGDNPNLTGFPDSALLDRNEGYEVLGFINHFAKIHKWRSDNAVTGHKVEKMIRTGLPGTTRGRNQVSAWLASNWSRY